MAPRLDWHELWCGDKALNETFLDLYGTVCMKDTSVAAQLELSGGSNQWNVSFAKAAHDWEIDIFALFFSWLYSVSWRHEGDAKLWRTPSKKWLFNVRPFYNAMVRIDDSLFLWKIIWRTKAPLRVIFFASWTILGSGISL